MAQLVIVYWRDIPAQVIVRAGRVTAKREMPPRFAAAIDSAAMRAGLTGTDAYLEGWRRAEPISCGDDIEAEAASAVASLDGLYDADRLRSIAAAGGADPRSTAEA